MIDIENVRKTLNLAQAALCNSTLPGHERDWQVYREAQRAVQETLLSLPKPTSQPAQPASQEQAKGLAMCGCGDRRASQCDEEWGPNCDLGNNPAHVKVVPVQQPSGEEVVRQAQVALDEAGSGPKPCDWMEAALKVCRHVVATPKPQSSGGEVVTRESALEAIEHVEQYNGPGRAAEARRMLATPNPEPMTDEQATDLAKVGPVYAPEGKVTRTPQQYRDELRNAKVEGIRLAESHYGITKGEA